MTVCVIDSSALIALAFAESTATALTARLVTYPQRFIGTPTLIESSIVHVTRHPRASESAIVELLDTLKIETIDFSIAMQQHAWLAWLRYGKGRHKASLNYGDCMSYGVASAMNAPLLFIGNDFSCTDIAVA